MLSITEIKTYMTMAKESYDEIKQFKASSIDGSNYTNLTTEGFIAVNDEIEGSSKNNGFSAAAYFNPKTGELIFSFGGTESMQDLGNDITLALANTLAQTSYVESYVQTTINAMALLGQSANKIVFTGHSLGGMLAQHGEVYFSNKLDVPTQAIVFNSTGYPNATEIAENRDDIDVQYYYSDPTVWTKPFVTGTHKLDERFMHDNRGNVFYVNNPNPDGYESQFDGHGLDKLFSEVDAGSELIEQQELIDDILLPILEKSYFSPENALIKPFTAWDYLKNAGYPVEDKVIALTFEKYTKDSCFTSGTFITLSDGSRKPIEEIVIGDVVMSFGEDGALRPAPVTQLLDNVTDTWLQLSNGTVVTPGHRFLRPDGSFMEIKDIIASDGEIVAEDGSIMTVTAEVINYSTETAQLFEVSCFRRNINFVHGKIALNYAA